MSSSPFQSLSFNDSQKKALEASFKKFDTNSDGRISFVELKNVISALGSPFSSIDVNRLMEKADTDKDGFISVDEFLSMQYTAVKTDKEKADLEATFELFDSDCDGFISPEELHKLMVNLGDGHITVRDCGRMIKAVDQDGDGKCNFEDFKVLMKGL